MHANLFSLTQNSFWLQGFLKITEMKNILEEKSRQEWNKFVDTEYMNYNTLPHLNALLLMTQIIDTNKKSKKFGEAHRRRTESESGTWIDSLRHK